MCVALNIISGYPDGSYKPEGNITRAEFTKMLCVLLNGGNTPATATNATPTFSDIRTSANASWAEGFIEYCYAKGIVSGIGDGKFNPNGNVTATEAAKMLLVALGYNADVESYTGAAWALKVNVQANQDGLYKDLEKIDTNAALTRDNAAQMVWNALQAYVIDKSSSIDRTDGSVTDIYTKSTTVDLLAKMYKGETEEAQMTGFTYNSTDKNWKYTIGEGKDAVTVKSSNDYTALLGQVVKAVYDDSTKGATKDAYGIFATDSEVLLTGVVGDLPTIAADDTSFKVDGTTYKLDNDPDETVVYVFTDKLVASSAAGNLLTLAGKDVKNFDSQQFAAIDKDGNGKVDFLMVYPVAVAKIASATSSTIKLTEVVDPMGVMASSESFDTDDVTAYTGVAKGDYVAFTAANNTADNTAVLVKADLISGKIVKKSGDDVTIGSNVYTIDVSSKVQPSVGTNLTDAVVVNGYIFDADSSASADASDYVVVVNADLSDPYGATVKLLFSDGTKKVVDLDEFVGVTGTGTDKAIVSDDIIGNIFTYETNSDDEYTLTLVEELDNAKSGKFTSTSSSGSKIAYIDGNTVLDDSVIFVAYNNDKSFKAITGAKLKTMSKNDFTKVVYMNKSSNTSTGVGDINFAYVVSSESDISTSDKYYGYVTDIASVKNTDNKTVYEFTLWTDKGEITLKTEAGLKDADKVDTNTILAYKLNSDGEISNVKAATVESGAVSQITSAFMAVDNGDPMYFDDDVIIITIDTSDTSGVSYGCTYKDIDTADDGVDNVYYVLDDGDVIFVAYDVDGLTK